MYICVSGENDMHTVEGFIIDRNKNKLRFLYGRWNEFLCSADPEVFCSVPDPDPELFGLKDPDPKLLI